jgi:WD40 repeat protein
MSIRAAVSTSDALHRALDPERTRLGRARLSWANRELAVLVGAALIGVVSFSNLDSGPAPPRLRLVRGDGDRRAQTVALAFSPTGTLIATTHSDGRVALRSPIEGGRVPQFLGDRGHAWAVAFAPDGRSLALGGFESDVILCDLAATGAERPMGMAIEQTKALVFSPDGRTLAAGSNLSDQIILWDMDARRERTRLRGHSSGVLSLAFATDGRSLVSGGRSDHTIIVWDLATGSRLRLAAPGPIVALSLWSDGSLLASASAIERSVRIWDPAAGCVVRRIESHAPSLSSVAFAPGSRKLATADNDGTVKLWDVATGRRLARLEGQADRVSGIAISPDGRTLAAIGNDNDVRLWDVDEVVGMQ